jgi:hypothetical protein
MTGGRTMSFVLSVTFGFVFAGCGASSSGNEATKGATLRARTGRR